jgi:NADPH:quinone reductase-like Zn-dependent oxidoreductase
MKPVIAWALAGAMFATMGAGVDPPTMKAVRVHEFGGLEVLKYEDSPKPAAGAGEILLRVKAAGVNPVDAGVRNGWMKGRATLPYTPGYDVSGVVESVGQDVKAFKPGDEVFAYLDLSRGGGYAEFAIVKEREAATKPSRASHSQAAGVPLTALTAWQALFDTAKLEKGQTVLIHGGSGGVGTMAVQLAKWKGARVLATASTENQAYLKELGADVCIDYKTQRFEEIAKEIDVVLDAVGGDTQARSFGVMKKGGVLVSIVGAVAQDKAKDAGVRGVNILVKPNGEQLAEIAKLIDDGQIKPIVSQELPLSEARKAQELVESKHTRGKIVLKVGS